MSVCLRALIDVKHFYIRNSQLCKYNESLKGNADDRTLARDSTFVSYKVVWDRLTWQHDYDLSLYLRLMYLAQNTCLIHELCT